MLSVFQNRRKSVKKIYKFLRLGKVHTNEASLWKHFTLDIPLLTLMVSAGLSGYGVYISYKDTNEILGYLVAFAAVSLGLVVTSYIKIIIEKYHTNKYHRKKYVFLVVTIMIAWLFISPTYNAMTFNSTQAIKSELKEQYIKMEKTANPYIVQDVLYKRIAEIISSSYLYLNNEYETQSSPQNGGCGTICHKIGSLISEIKPTYNEFSKIYGIQSNEDDEDEKEDTIGIQLQDTLTTLESEIDENNDITDLLQAYNEARNTISSSIMKISMQNDPLNKAIDILESLKGFQRFLQSQSSNQYAKITIDSIKTKIKNLEDEINQIKSKRISKSMIIKPQFPKITLNINLIWKHALEYWSLMVFAFLIDIIAFILLLLPLLDSETTKRIADIVKELKVLKRKQRRYEEELDILKSGNSTYDKSIAKLQALIDYEEEDNAQKIYDEKIELEKELKEKKVQKKKLDSELDDELSNMENKSEEESAKILSLEDLDLTEKKYAYIKKNIKDKYAPRISRINNEITLISDRLFNTEARLKFLNKNDQEIMVYSKDLEDLEDKKSEKILSLIQKINELREDIEELEEEKKDLLDMEDKNED